MSGTTEQLIHQLDQSENTETLPVADLTKVDENNNDEKNDNVENTETAAPWVKTLRKRQKELAAENRKLKDELEKLTKPAAPQQLGPKPTLEMCEFDGEKLTAELEKWIAKKLEIDNINKHVEAAQAKIIEEWQKKQKVYFDDRAEFSKTVVDFESAEKAVIDILPEELRSDLIDISDNAVSIVYKIGSDIDLLENLAGMTRSQFAHALGKLSDKVTKPSRSSAPEPEKMAPKGGSPKSTNATLEQLRREAEKTGDYSKVVAFKRANKPK